VERDTPSKSLTAICIEVADPEIMAQWLHKGWMPNLARLRAEGLWTRLESVPHFSSGAIWPTFFTGVDPSEHGQFFTHMQLRPGTYDIVKMYADDVPLPPFWLELQRMGGDAR
jgi:predicted AlkP superfamily phosphohydrolase/phosphomutase